MHKPKTQDDIDNIARRTRDAGVPDHLNRWLGMTPEKLAESEARIARSVAADQHRRSTNMPKTAGPKEQAMREMRETPGKKPNAEKTAGAKRPKATTTARTPVQDKGEKTPSAGRPAEKQETIKGLLSRKSKVAAKHGCTAKEVMEACNWPSVSMPQQASALGLTLHKFKPEGSPTRYASTPFPGQPESASAS